MLTQMKIVIMSILEIALILNKSYVGRARTGGGECG